MSVLLRVVANAVCTVERAGKIIRDVLHSGSLGIVDKAQDDPQTEADRSAEKCIVTSLSKSFPKMKIIGEEGSQQGMAVDDDWIVEKLDEAVLKETLPPDLSNIREEDIVCWVDPLDGTREFTQGLLDHVTVLVGFAVGGRAIAGVIHQPFFNCFKQTDPPKQGRTMWGIVGVGIRGITPSTPIGGKIITITRSHSSPAINDCIDAMRPTEVIRVGGAGHKVLLLIEGRAHIFVFASPGCKKWDTCATEALLEAAGGALTDIHGNRILYHADVEHKNLGGVLATCSKALLPECLQEIPASVREALPILNRKL